MINNWEAVTLPILLILIACLLWGVDPILRFPLVEAGTPVTTIVFWEHIIMVALLAPHLPQAIRALRSNPQLIYSFLLLGVLSSALATLTFTWAFTYLSPSLVILLQKLKTFTGLAMAAWLLGERPGATFYWWSGLAMLGGLMVSFPHLKALVLEETQTYEAYKPLIGYGLVAVTIVGWGGGTVFARQILQQGVREMPLIAGRYTVGLLCLLPLVSGNISALAIDSEGFGRIIIMTIFSGYVAIILFYKGLARTNASMTSILEMFSTVFAVGFSWLILGHGLTVIQIAGGVVLCYSSYMITRSKLRQQQAITKSEAPVGKVPPFVASVHHNQGPRPPE